MYTTLGETAIGPTSILKDSATPEIRALPPNMRAILHENNIKMVSEGKGWFRCKLTSIDEQPIEYFNVRGDLSIGTNEWVAGFDVINREQMEIIKLLKQIRDKIQWR